MGAGLGSTREPWVWIPCLSHPRKPSAFSEPWIPQPQTRNTEQRRPLVPSVMCAVLPLVQEAARDRKTGIAGCLCLLQITSLQAVRPLCRPKLPPPVNKSICPVPLSLLSSSSTAGGSAAKQLCLPLRTGHAHMLPLKL